jgi:hypothetical protein
VLREAVIGHVAEGLRGRALLGGAEAQDRLERRGLQPPVGDAGLTS